MLMVISPLPMASPEPADSELLKSILEPILEDFQHWLGRSQTFLESTELPFMTPEQQADLHQRVTQAKQEVTAAQSLFQATNGMVGVETAALANWHRLVSECWQVSYRFRQGTSAS